MLPLMSCESRGQYQSSELEIISLIQSPFIVVLWLWWAAEPIMGQRCGEACIVQQGLV